VTGDMNLVEKRRILVKLHRQFGHATADRVGRLLKSAGEQSQDTFDLLQDVVDNCDVCAKYRSATPRPVVGFSLASDYNETVAVDLHQLDGSLWYLHIIDEFSRFSAACIIDTKRSSVIVDKFIQCWIGVHGAPKRLYSDNGGEFNNGEFRDMAENFNIEVRTTPAFSPWSNGLLERHNRTLTEILLKVRADSDVDWQTALAWALNAKNSLHSVHGYSPYQVAFGQNPNLSSVLNSEPLALEATTISSIVGKHISALHATRKAFLEAESSEKIRRALRKQIRPSGDNYVTGDRVYYKRPDSVKWKGPGVVIGQDGVVVFVRHGGLCVRVHQCRLRRTCGSAGEGGSVLSKPDIAVISLDKAVVSQDRADTPSDPNLEEAESDIDDDGQISGQMNNEGMVNNDEQISGQNNSEGTVNDSGQSHTFRIQDQSVKPGQSVKFQLRDSGEVQVGKVLGRAGKASGPKRYWYNIEYTQPVSLVGTQGSIDLSTVEQLQEVDLVPQDVDESVLVLDNVSFGAAKDTELDSWKSNCVYEEVLDTGQKCISTKWICTLKETADGIKPKARLVARGFEEVETRDLPKDSPTCSTESLRVIFFYFC
jgi:transposase InsO family protein